MFRRLAKVVPSVGPSKVQDDPIVEDVTKFSREDDPEEDV